MTKKMWWGLLAWMLMGLCVYYAGKKTAAYFDKKKETAAATVSFQKTDLPLNVYSAK